MRLLVDVQTFYGSESNPSAGETLDVMIPDEVARKRLPGTELAGSIQEMVNATVRRHFGIKQEAKE